METPDSIATFHEGQAESLIHLVEEALIGRGPTDPAVVLAQAQVHATLGLSARMAEVARKDEG